LILKGAGGNQRGADERRCKQTRNRFHRRFLDIFLSAIFLSNAGLTEKWQTEKYSYQGIHYF
jgi:hypothetical protein